MMVQGEWNTVTYCYNDAKGYLTYGTNLCGRAAFGAIADTLSRTGYAELKRFLKNGISEKTGGACIRMPHTLQETRRRPAQGHCS